MHKKKINGLAVNNRKDSIQAVLMIMPTTVGFILFTYVPIVYNLRYAMYDYNGSLSTYIGLENFVRIFTRDVDYWKSLGNTFIIAFGKLSIEIPLALCMAILLNKNLPGTAIFRVGLFLPAIISTAIVGLVFSLMFSSFDGIVNTILQNLHIIEKPINWFGSKWTAMLVLVIASVWQNFGINMIFFLVALQRVPKELYECASIDGASSWTKFRHITLPMIGTLFQVILLLAIVGSIKMSDLVLASTNGQPGGSTEVVMTYVFKYFFGYLGHMIEIGYASAMSIVTAIILAIIAIVYLNVTKKMRLEQ